ncbi:LacI family DNA-binding transcriptional regulator [Azospirillum sp. ST 5-10]|uniref:LacI family DNA-binding transcriptional regulator n=1 Tax=unclassified Azospirillum TaxID=2630922 RepID=UPI003F4A7011
MDRQPARRATAAEVARLAGVSQSAVSRCFTPGASVSPAMRARVLEVADRLNYRPNALARGLTTARTDLVGVVMGDLDGPFQPYLFERLTRGLATLGKQSLLIRGDPAADLGGAAMAALDYQVDAVVVTAGSVAAETVRSVMELGTPLLLYGRVVAEDGVDAVCCDNRLGARLAAEALVAAGHRRIAYVAGRAAAFSEQERSAAFREALAELGVPLVAEARGDYGYASGHRAALELLGAAPRPDALFCGNDAMAFGALDAARMALGLRVPDDVSIVGFDDVPMAAWPGYDLTTVRNPVDETVRTLLAMLGRRLADPAAAPVRERPAPELVVRGSARLAP